MAMANYIQVSHMWNFLRVTPKEESHMAEKKITITVTNAATTV